MTENTTSAKLTIRPAEGKWVAYVSGAVYAETSNALELIEGDQPPAIYFPRGDVAMAFFDKVGTAVADSGKGTPTQFSIDSKSRIIENAALSFEDPTPDAEAIRDYLTFDTALVTVEKH